MPVSEWHRVSSNVWIDFAALAGPSSSGAPPPGSKRIKREPTETEDDEIVVDDILVRTGGPGPSSSRSGRVPEVFTVDDDDDEIIIEMQKAANVSLEQKLRQQMAAENGEPSTSEPGPSTSSAVNFLFESFVGRTWLKKYFIHLSLLFMISYFFRRIFVTD